MSAPSASRKTKPRQRLLTVADLAMMPSDLPSGPVLWELDHGRLVAMPPPGDIHGGVEAKFTARLLNFVEQHNLGKVRCGEVAVILGRNPDHVVGADVAFIGNASLPLQLSTEGYLETMPDLVVEVRSKNDTGPELERKAKDYLTAGVRVVWVADPKKQTVTAYRRNRKPKVFTATDTLTIEDVIPGFAMPVVEVFRT